MTGASGQLGAEVVRMAHRLGWDVFGTFMSHPAPGPVFHYLDVTDRAAIGSLVEDLRPEAVIHAAANSDLDWCDRHKDLAYEINAVGARNVARACKMAGAFLIYVSTDYVFDGQAGPYGEEDAPRPVVQYGFTKLSGEEQVMETSPAFCVARTSMQFGWAGTKENLATHVLRRLRSGQKVQAVADLIVSPSYSGNVAEMLLEIVERRWPGVLNVCGATRMTRYQFAQKVAEAFGEDPGRITPGTSEQIQWKTPRPKNCGLDVTQAMQALRRRPMCLEAALTRMRDEEIAAKPERAHVNCALEPPTKSISARD